MSFHEGTNNLLGQGNQARETARKQQEAKQDEIATERQHNLSKEQAKQDQTTTTASKPSKPLPHCQLSHPTNRLTVVHTNFQVSLHPPMSPLRMAHKGRMVVT